MKVQLYDAGVMVKEADIPGSHLGAEAIRYGQQVYGNRKLLQTKDEHTGHVIGLTLQFERVISFVVV